MATNTNNYSVSEQSTLDQGAQLRQYNVNNMQLSEPQSVTLQGLSVTGASADTRPYWEQWPTNETFSTVSSDNGWGYDMSGSPASGPLNSLYQNNYTPRSMSYPKDLDNFDKGHVVQFNIRDIKPTKISNLSEIPKYIKQEFSRIVDPSVAVFKAAYNGVKPEGSDIASQAEYRFEQLQAGALAASDFLMNSQDVKQLLKLDSETMSDKMTSIRLYMPDTMSFTSQAQYDKLSLADAVNSTPLIGKISTAATSIANNNMAKLISKKLGYTFNPQQQMLFEGIDFREFDLSFTFIPTSADEAETIKNIIRTLQRSSAPTLTQSTGFYWIPPSIFDIGFFFNGMISPYVPPTLQCVLQSVTVDYAPNGWAALSDGSPMQTNVSLSFKEIQLLDRDTLDGLYGKTNSMGYNIGGSVGSSSYGSNRITDNPGYNQELVDRFAEETRQANIEAEEAGSPDYAVNYQYDIPIETEIGENE